MTRYSCSDSGFFAVTRRSRTRSLVRKRTAPTGWRTPFADWLPSPEKPAAASRRLSSGSPSVILAAFRLGEESKIKCDQKKSEVHDRAGAAERRCLNP
jgi:hypothetical protein